MTFSSADSQRIVIFLLTTAVYQDVTQCSKDCSKTWFLILYQQQYCMCIGDTSLPYLIDS